MRPLPLPFDNGRTTNRAPNGAPLEHADTLSLIERSDVDRNQYSIGDMQFRTRATSLRALIPYRLAGRLNEMRRVDVPFRRRATNSFPFAGRALSRAPRPAADPLYPI
jgi:hypothetical protein